MKYGTWVAIYFVCWWLCLFVVLPFGIRSQVEEGAVVPGSEPGAPVKTNVIRIILYTSALAFALFALVWWLIENHWMT